MKSFGKSVAIITLEKRFQNSRKLQNDFCSLKEKKFKLRFQGKGTFYFNVRKKNHCNLFYFILHSNNGSRNGSPFQ